jgi:hypothetical protein
MKDREKLKEEGDEKIVTTCINTIDWHLTTKNFSPFAFFPT